MDDKPEIKVVHPYKTLRDEFAMACLPIVQSTTMCADYYRETAENCYRMADAMLKARAQ